MGKRIEEYFIACLEYDEVGAIICNDDWGSIHKQCFPSLLRKYVFPWYKRIVEKAHRKGNDFNSVATIMILSMMLLMI